MICGNSLSCYLLFVFGYKSTVQLPFSGGLGEGFVDIRKNLFIVLFFIPPGKDCLLLTLNDMLNISQILNFGICTKFTTPRKQLTKVCLGSKKNSEMDSIIECAEKSSFKSSSAELLSCFKGTLTDALGFILLCSLWYLRVWYRELTASPLDVGSATWRKLVQNIYYNSLCIV